MKIKFCGAAKDVTGSSHLITLDNGTKILLDCGLFQGNEEIEEKNKIWHFDPKDIDYVILSHSHIDHIGRSPKLIKDGYKGKFHCTYATRDLAQIMLLDSAKIQERDAEYYNKQILKKRKKGKFSKKYKFIEPLYTSKDVVTIGTKIEGHHYDEWFSLSNDVKVLLRDTGHILGSASVTLKITEGDKTTMLGFTGDIGRPDRPILKDPIALPPVEYLICESTYGDKKHEDKDQEIEKFVEIVKQTCCERRGRVIIPAFSVGRTQELVYLIDRLVSSGRIPEKLPIIVDSPLSVNATRIFAMHPECFDKELTEYLLTDLDPFGMNSVEYVQSLERSKELNYTKDPAIIISASGMMNAGRVVHHIFHAISNPNNTLLIVGYCSPSTLGGVLRNNPSEIKIFGEIVKVNARIEIMGSFSAHGDQDEMYQFIKNQKKSLKQLFLVHGEEDTQIKFKKFLQAKKFSHIMIPTENQVFEVWDQALPK